MKNKTNSKHDIMRNQAIRIAGGSVLLAAGIQLIFEAGCQRGITMTEDVIRALDPDSYEVISRKIKDFVNTHQI